MPDGECVVRHLMIRGLVQGVAYRANAQLEAERLGLDGWVRNRADGRVEALVAGPAEAVEAFVAWAHEGPSLARVESVEIGAADRPEHRGFRLLPTA